MTTPSRKSTDERTLDVRLISMPYTMLTMPSIGLAQLQAVVRTTMPKLARVETAYFYLDFAEFIGGLDAYASIGNFESQGLLDWMFRSAAFDAPDNVEEYRRYFFSDGTYPRKKEAFELASEKRNELDAFLDGLIDEHSLGSCDVAGFTSMMSQNVASFALARRLKTRNPNVITALGGPNTEHPMGKTIAEHVPQIDYVFSGEALVNFPAFLRAVHAGDLARTQTLRGVHSRTCTTARAAGAESFRSSALSDTLSGRKLPVLAVVQESGGCGTSELEENSGEAFDLNQMPMLDYSAYLERIDRSPYRDQLKADLTIPFQTSTGCWWADKVPCSFCGLTPHAFRKMNAEKARSYIAELVEKYRGRFSVFEATDPCMPVEYPKEVFSSVNQDRAAVMQYEVKARMPVADLVEMARANVILPQPGIESLSTKTLKIMRKGVTAFDNVQFLKRCTENGLYPIWNYLYGFPNPDYDELDTGKLVDDIQTLCHLPPPASSVPISFQRYSEYFKDHAKYGLKLRPAPHYAYSYPFEEPVISELAYTFVDAEYFAAMERKHSEAIRAINEQIVNWMFKFRDDIPRLCFSDDCVIYDSRFDEPEKYRVTPLERDVLRFLDQPHSVSDVANRFGLERAQAGGIIEQFETARLVFSERDKHLSVVCERCALTADLYKNYYISFVKNSSTAFE